MTSENTISVSWVAASVFVSLAIVGYFVGLQAPMPDRAELVRNGGVSRTSPPGTDSSVDDHPRQNGVVDLEVPQKTGLVIPATAYLDMAAATRNRMKSQRTVFPKLKSNLEPLQELVVTESEKLVALKLRSRNRAFNGAPPTVPHPIDPLSARSCMACHGEGIRTSTLRVAKISHPFLYNCTQCHVESNPTHIRPVEFRESTFVGLPAPTGGPRAFPGAPPQMPHSTWMREDCLSCHGLTGSHGIQTTHPWRQNCQQCHAPASEFDQIQLRSQPEFLAPIKINPPMPRTDS